MLPNRSPDRLAHVAQSVEHLHGKQKVSGSIPLVGSTMHGRAGCAAVLGVAGARPPWVSGSEDPEDQRFGCGKRARPNDGTVAMEQRNRIDISPLNHSTRLMQPQHAAFRMNVAPSHG